MRGHLNVKVTAYLTGYKKRNECVFLQLFSLRFARFTLKQSTDNNATPSVFNLSCSQQTASRFGSVSE